MSERKRLYQECKLMAPASTAPSVLISLHPLVIMNVSDHWTRVKAQSGKPSNGIINVLKAFLVLLLTSLLSSIWCFAWSTKRQKFRNMYVI